MSEEPLAAPQGVEQAGTEEEFWTVVAKNERVKRGWQELIKTAEASAAKCYDYLRRTQMVIRPRRIFPLRGKRYAGAWEYELTGGDRVFYIPDRKVKKVTVYYAGPHPKSAPVPPT